MGVWLLDSDWNSTDLGDVANNVKITSGGTMTFIDPEFGIHDGSGGIANNTIVQSGGYMSVDNGGTANNTQIYAGGSAFGVIFIDREGLGKYKSYMNSTTVYSGGALQTGPGFIASHTEVKSGGSMMIIYAGEAYETIVSSGGRIIISGYGGTYGNSLAANVDLKKGGKMEVGDAAVVTESVLAGTARIESGGRISDSTIAAGGIVYALIDVRMENITVNTSGNLYVDLGAEVDNITLNGGNVHVGMGGRISDVEIDSGKLYLYGGAILDGVINVNGTMVLDDMTMNYGTVNLNLESASSASPMIENMKFLSGGNYTIDVDNADNGSYIIGSNAGEFNSSFTITSNGDEIGSISVGETLNVGDCSYTIVKEDERIIVKSAVTLVPEIVSFSVNGIVFASSNDYVVEYSANNFSNVLQLEFTGTQIDTYNMTGGDIGFRTRLAKRDILTEAQKIQAPANSASPQKIVSNANDALDVFFADSDGIWSGFYAAEHNGSIGEWEGTKEMVTLDGKNCITDIFEGSADANILVLTDSANGDALFIDDIYSASPDAERTARFAQINEIRAGAGDDIIDMTSQRFEYSGNEITIRGGSGNDVIWAAGSDNDLFGDAGNDRIVGSAGFDIIIGGAGDDSMHSGGGDDIFAFCENWGVDTVEITDNANITLWFAAGNKNNWDAESRIYRDGSNSVTVIGGANSTIDLKFGDEGGQYSDMLDIGAFEPSSGERIFEDKALIA